MCGVRQGLVEGLDGLTHPTLIDGKLQALLRDHQQGDLGATRRLLRQAGEVEVQWCLRCDGSGRITASDTELAWGEKESRSCPTCPGTGRLPVAETLSAQAYLGDQWARVLSPFESNLDAFAGFQDVFSGMGFDMSLFESQAKKNPLGTNIAAFFHKQLEGNLAAWASGLTRWPQVAVSAAVGAGRECYKRPEEWDEDCLILAALNAADDWAREPTAERREAWQVAQGHDMPTGLPEWVPRVHDVDVARDRAPKQNWAQRLQAAARELCDDADCDFHRPCSGDARARTAATTHARAWLRGEE